MNERISCRFIEEYRSNWKDDVEALLLELTGRRVEISHDYFLEIAYKSRWLAAMDEDEKIVGMATLVPKRIPTGLAGHIDDVATLKAYQGRGIGKGMMLRLFDEARRMKMRQVSLTSNPKREAANALYAKLGMERYETNYYRLKL